MPGSCVRIGNLYIGEGYPVRVESMLKVPLDKLADCKKQIEQLQKCGCELARVAFPRIELGKNLSSLIEFSPIPLMADIHFDHKLAIEGMDKGCRAIRINPGNMDSSGRLRDVIDAARQNDVVIRIGANSGSINNRQLEAANGDIAEALFIAVEEQLLSLLDLGFNNIIISAKSTNVQETVKSNYLLSTKYPDFPFHIGVTEAGPGSRGIAKSSCGLALLLNQGIGDTLRVSLTGDPCQEVETGYEILRATGLRDHGVELISCPTCGRRRADVFSLVEELKPLLEKMPDGFKFAVMGCEVNGPREASSADLGIAGSPNGLILFRKGVVVGEYQSSEIKKAIEKILLEFM